MGEGIHTLHGDIKRVKDGDESYLDRARRTALYLNLDTVAELLNDKEYNDALQLTLEKWRAGHRVYSSIEQGEFSNLTDSKEVDKFLSEEYKDPEKVKAVLENYGFDRDPETHSVF